MIDDQSFDAQRVDAYHKSIQAEKLLAEGRLDEARELMTIAASLDLTYTIRAQLLGHPDDRKVEVSKTIRKTLVPFLLAAGFEIRGGQSWSEGTFFQRQQAEGGADTLLIGRDKFGHRLGVIGVRERASGVEYFNWKTIGLRSGTLAYTTQSEVEVVCVYWQQLISTHLFPWWLAE